MPSVMVERGAKVGSVQIVPIGASPIRSNCRLEAGAEICLFKL